MKPDSKTTASPKLQEQTRLVRLVVASLAIKVPDDRDKRFRSSLLNKVKSEISGFPEGLIVRLYEAATGIEFADADVIAFRGCCQDRIGRSLSLQSYRNP